MLGITAATERRAGAGSRCGHSPSAQRCSQAHTAPVLAHPRMSLRDVRLRRSRCAAHGGQAEFSGEYLLESGRVDG